MWIWMSVISACLLGVYDVAKKRAVLRNGVLYVLLCATTLSTIFLIPFFRPATLHDHLSLLLKAFFVTTSWVSGLIGLKHLPVTTCSTIKASRPFFVVVLSIVMFGEKLNLWQWGGVALALLSIVLLSRSSQKEGISFRRNRGVWAMGVAVLSGVASALYDKMIIRTMEPLLVQCWANFYITLLLALTLAFVLVLRRHKVAALDPGRFHWDWMLLVIAVVITVSDCLYFFALKQPGSLLSVISLVRRCSVIVTFVLGALLFKEKHLRSKALSLSILLAGMALLVIGS